MPSILDIGKKKSYSPEVDAKVERLNIEIKEAREKEEELEKVVSQYTKKLDNAYKRENLFARIEKEYGHGKHGFFVPPFFTYSRDFAEDMAFNAHFNKLEKENIFKRIAIGIKDALFVAGGFFVDLLELPGFLIALGGVNIFKGIWNAATKGAEQKAEDKYRVIHDKLFAEELMYRKRWNKLIDERNAIVAEFEGRTKDYEAYMQYRACEEAAEIEHAKQAGIDLTEQNLAERENELRAKQEQVDNLEKRQEANEKLQEEVKNEETKEKVANNVPEKQKEETNIANKEKEEDMSL